ncbi:hypothetical protein [Paenibacillus sp. URB8-2]|uniref:hypothetical protein n=1 Tax=Paenibacillus sp. URB8-2 TaxID=2741301 RepID=UPI0015BE0894|nr:hypothetical protein [Paenibacillus sp. URB8-2]BCG60798.1 hypothetical protein PUR_42230 [Paenibacillus sp. URB8-2]
MKTSPMLNHAIESFQHGVEHYLDGTIVSRKFAVLHIDHALELFLKEKVVQLGKSIYKSDGNTLSLHETLNSLKEIKIIELPRLQEIHDLRNTIQHKGITPDEMTTEFLVDVAYHFIKRFATEELQLDFNNILPERYVRLMEPESQKFKLPDIKYLPSIDYNSDQQPIDQVINAFTVFDKYVKAWQENNPGLIGFRPTVTELAVVNGYDKTEVKQMLMTIFSLKTKVTQSEYFPSEDETKKFIDLINGLIFMMVINKNNF